MAFLGGPGGFRELREAGRNHFHLSWFEGVAKVPQDSLDRSPGKRHREGSPYARLTGPDVRACRASLASISATGTPVAAVPCVLFSFLHIFPTQNLYLFEKSSFFALKRNAKRSFWPQTYIFQMKNQDF